MANTKENHLSSASGVTHKWEPAYVWTSRLTCSSLYSANPLPWKWVKFHTYCCKLIAHPKTYKHVQSYYNHICKDSIFYTLFVANCTGVCSFYMLQTPTRTQHIHMLHTHSGTHIGTQLYLRSSYSIPFFLDLVCLFFILLHASAHSNPLIHTLQFVYLRVCFRQA